MVSICLYFQVHQPLRLRKYSVFEVGQHRHYFDDDKNREIMRKIAEKCYLPATALLKELVALHQGKFKVAFSFSGIALEQFSLYAPEVLTAFCELAQTGHMEILAETYYHSLASLYSMKEFKEQILLHTKKIQELFGVTPKVFRNTELIYHNEIGKFIAEQGFVGILAEGWEHYLQWRSPNFLYTPIGTSMKMLLKNYRLSDDIAFRFSNKSWSGYPLTATKFADWVNAVNGNGAVVNLFMDFETFGEHQWEDTGIFRFLASMPGELLKNRDNKFLLPSEVIAVHDVVGELDIPYALSWADLERDVSAWTGNKMQQAALQELYALEPQVRALNDPHLLDLWRKLQTSDHFYYMSTKYFSDGDVHKYFNPYDS
ncbi:MAG TPA: glycoside hydrolase family 57 protein, partial [Candidatus Nanoarchaeia archaeon]|nr:glycoside hydrolase family 57 protein [Candidatus Nanoarchaeia archaeon]